MKLKKLLVYLLTASIMMESVLPVYATEAKSAVVSEVVETSETEGTTVSENILEEVGASEDDNEDETVMEEITEKDEMTETEENTESEETIEEEMKEPAEEAEEKPEDEASVSGNSISENNAVTTVSEDTELDYILGREMTPEEIAQQQALVPHLVEMEPLELDTDDLYAGININLLSELEESYDSRDFNIITNIRDQNPWGTCWAFATHAIMESSLVKQQLADRDSIDLSERHLAYFVANTGYDALGNANEDTLTQPSDAYYLDSGGNISKAAMRLMNWQGAAAEADYPYSTSIPAAIPREYAQDIVAIAKDIYFIPTQGASTADEVSVIKKLIKTYGAVGWSYYHGNTYYNASTGAYNCNVAKGTNHAITLVGWDDTYAKENFSTNCQPQNNGAWIVKNSWGSNWGDEGYFYISYEDATLGEGNDAGVMIADTANEYDNNYFYSNGIGTNYYNEVSKVAQVFEAKSGAEQEILKAVSFMLYSANEPYEIQVYKNPVLVNGVVKNPESGEKMYETPVTGTTGYAGVYTADIPEVTVQSGETFAVVVSFTDGIGASVRTDKDYTYSQVVSKNVTEAGQSFLSFGYWYDLKNQNCSARMNVFTTNKYGDTPILRYKAENPLNFEDALKNNIIWTRCLNVNKYEIYRSDSEDGNYSLLGEVAGSLGTYQDEVSPEYWNKNLYYKVKAIFLDGSIAESDILEVFCKATIEMSEINVVKQQNENEISWGAVTGADGYKIERKLLTEEEFTDLVTITDDSVLTYTDILNDVNDVYEYRVQAYNDSKGNSLWSNSAVGAAIYLESYYKELSDGSTERAYKVSWDSINADEYKIYLSINGSEYIYDGTKYGKSYNLLKNEDTQIGEEYKVLVEPYYYTGGNSRPNPYKVVSFVWLPNAVTEVIHEYKSGEATFTWKGAEDAEFIDVYRSTDADSHGETIFTTINPAEETEFNDTGLNRGDCYYYWFYAGVTNDVGEKVYSEVYCHKIELPLNAESIELELETETATKGEQIDITVSEIYNGEKNAYAGNIIWSAKNGQNDCDIETEDNITKVLGSDGKEILRISDRILEVTGESIDKKVTLTAHIGNLTDEVSFMIVVPISEVDVKVVSVNGEAKDVLPEHLYLNDVIVVKAEYSPENADVDEIQWKCDDPSMVTLKDNGDGTATVTIIKAGETCITLTGRGGESFVEKRMDLSSELKSVTIHAVNALDANQLQILWDSVYEEETYNIYRKENEEVEYSLMAENVSQTDYIDDTVETGVKYSYKIQLVKDGTVSNLNTTEAKEGRTLPEGAVVLEKTYRSVTIKNDILYEYAISKEDNREELQYISSETENEIEFNNLEAEQTYYVFARLKKFPDLYGETVQVTLPEKGKLIFTSDNISLSKGENYTVTYKISTGEKENEILGWSAYYIEDNRVCTGRILENGGLSFEGKDGKEICRIIENTIIATGLSETKELLLSAKNSNDIEGTCNLKIQVPVEEYVLKDITINGENVSNIDVLNINDKVSFKIEIEPENADACTITWNSSNNQILQVVASEDGKTVELDALNKGACKLSAVTSNGFESFWQINVINKNEILEYRIVKFDEELQLADVVSGLNEDNTYILADFITRESELAASSAEDALKEQQLKVYGLKNHANAEIDNPIQAEDFYKLEVLSAEELIFVSTNPAVAIVSEDGRVTAVGEGKAEIYVYGKTVREKYGKYKVTVTGTAVSDEEECPIEKSVKLFAVNNKIYLEQFSHNSNSSAILEIQNNQGEKYPAEYFEFVSADSDVCVVDSNGVVRVNPTYEGTKDKTVKVTASVKNDLAKRKVTFNVVVYGKQQIAGLEVQYGNGTPNSVALKYAKNGTVMLSVKAYGSNGEEIAIPAVKWSVSNAAVATVKQNKDGTAIITMKKPGQCSIICTASDAWKNTDTLLLKAMDITPILDKKTIILETKTVSELIEAVESKKSESFTLTGVYGTEYAKPVIESVKLGKTELDESQFEVVDNGNNSYSIAASESVLKDIKHNSKLTVVLSAQIESLQEAVDFEQAIFNMTVQVMTKEPSITVKEAGTINRYYNSGENVRSLLTFKTTEEIVDVKVAKEGQINNFDTYFEVEEDNGRWYLVLRDTVNYAANSLKGNLLITLDGYEPIVKNITVKTPSKKPVITQQTTPLINVNYNNKQAEVTLLKNKVLMEDFTIEVIDAEKADVTETGDGRLLITLKDKEFKNNETVNVAVNLWETNEEGDILFETPVQVNVKAKVSTQVPKITLKSKTLTLNNCAVEEKAVTGISINQQNVSFVEETQWNIMEYNNETKKYDKSAVWLNADYEEESQLLSLGYDGSQDPGNYKIRIMNVLNGFENIPMDISIKVIDQQPSINVKVCGKLDLTNKAACSLVGKLSFKNTVANEIIAVEVIEDSRFEAKVISKDSIALTVTENGMPEESMDTTKFNVDVRLTLAGGTVVDAVMPIKPVCTIPKMTIPKAKTLYKSVANHEVRYDLGESLAEGVKIKDIQVVSAPNQFDIIIDEDVVLVSLKEKGLKATNYSIKIKVIFEGASGKPQNKTISVKVVE